MRKKDKEVTNLDMNKNYDKYDFENLKVATLIIHAKNDPLAPFEGAKKICKMLK